MKKAKSREISSTGSAQSPKISRNKKLDPRPSVFLEPVLGRRDFLKSAISLSALSACSTIEGSFQADRRIYDREVIVIGGGLAGLAAAYTLKKNKVPFRLFEADHRLGGRVFSQKFGTSGQSVELGGEFLSPQDSGLLGVLKELNFETFPITNEPKNSTPLFYQRTKQGATDKEFLEVLWKYQDVKGQGQSFFNLISKLKSESERTESQKNEIYQRMESKIGGEFFEKITEGSGPVFKAYLKAALSSEYGPDWDQLSGAFIFEPFLRGEDITNLRKQTRLKIKGGSGPFIQALGDRLRGVLPDFFVRTSMPLTKLTPRPFSFELQFEDHGRTRNLDARVIIFALPLTVLRKIGGMRDLELKNGLYNQIEKAQYGTQIKLYWGLNSTQSESILSRTPIQGDLLNQNISYTVSESGRSQILRSQHFVQQEALVDGLDVLKDLERLECVKKV